MSRCTAAEDGSPVGAAGGPGAMKRDANGRGTALLDKACDVLDAVGGAPGGLSQAELSARLALPRATLYRILSTLVGRGLLRQDGARHAYTLGLHLLDFAGQASTVPDLAAIAVPELRALRDITGETAYVAALDGAEVISLGKFEGAHEVRSAARLGQRKPLHCTSQGKSILAFLPAPQRDTILRRLKLPALTSNTITTRNALSAALELIRVRGFAVDDEEIVEGIRCVGAPVLRPDGSVAGAISVAGPAWRITRTRAELLGPEMAAAARRIGAMLRPAAPQPGGLRVVPGPPAFHGIDPFWSADEGRLWWGDALGPSIRSHHPADAAPRETRWDVPLRGLVPDGTGLVVVDAGGMATWLDAQDGVLGTPRRSVRIAEPGEVLATGLAPDGAVWASVADGNRSRIGALASSGHFRGEWMLTGAVTALAWAPDGTALYAAVPDAGAVHRLEPGRPGGRVLSRLPPGSGTPVALVVDGGGQVWAALRDGWSVTRLTPDGDIERVIPLPVPRPSGLAFGGSDLRTLFVATARDGIGLEVLASAPLSGQVLALDLDGPAP